MIELAIDEEVRALISPLTDEERAQLASNLRAEGCREPLVVWGGEPPTDPAHPCQVPWARQLALGTLCEQVTWICPTCGETRQRPYVLLDGHHRYEICRAHEIPLTLVEAPEWVVTQEEATIWILRNQLGRRNLEPYQKFELLTALESLLTEQAARRMTAGKAPDPGENLRQGKTSERIGEMIGVSGRTVEKMRVIAQAADEPTKAQLRRGQRSVHSVYQTVRRPRVASSREPVPMNPERAEQARMTGRLLELITTMIELAEALRGELAGQRTQFPQAAWAPAYDKMRRDLGQMRAYLQDLSHRAWAGRDWGDEPATGPAVSAD
jgi:hypothetical protein